MPRVTPVASKADVAPEHQAVVDDVLKVFGAVRGPFSMMLHSPEMTKRMLPLVPFFRDESVVESKLRSVGILAAVREREAAYVWAAQVAAARRNGCAKGSTCARNGCLEVRLKRPRSCHTSSSMRTNRAIRPAHAPTRPRTIVSSRAAGVPTRMLWRVSTRSRWQRRRTETSCRLEVEYHPHSFGNARNHGKRPSSCSTNVYVRTSSGEECTGLLVLHVYETGRLVAFLTAYKEQSHMCAVHWATMRPAFEGQWA